MSRWGGGDGRGQLGDGARGTKRGVPGVPCVPGGRGGDFQAAAGREGEGRAALLTAARAADILFMAPRPARRRPLALGQPDRGTRQESPRVVAGVLPGRLVQGDFLGFGTAWGASGNSGPQLAGKQRDGRPWVNGQGRALPRGIHRNWD